MASSKGRSSMRGVAWLVGAGALIGGGGWLMAQGDAGAAAHKQSDKVASPTHARPAEVTRALTRRTLKAPVRDGGSAPKPRGIAHESDGEAAAPPARAARDPLLVA